jgi:hypothetical protein
VWWPVSVRACRVAPTTTRRLIVALSQRTLPYHHKQAHRQKDPGNAVASFLQQKQKDNQSMTNLFAEFMKQRARASELENQEKEVELERKRLELQKREEREGDREPNPPDPQALKRSQGLDD